MIIGFLNQSFEQKPKLRRSKPTAVLVNSCITPQKEQVFWGKPALPTIFKSNDNSIKETTEADR